MVCCLNAVKAGAGALFLKAMRLVAIMAAGSVWAPALAHSSVRFVDLTWTEIADALQQGTTTIIVPIGGTEQSGPYLAVGKHDFRVGVQAERIAAGLGHTLVAPVIAYVPEGETTPRTSHMRYPGTISVPPEVFAGLVRGAAESFRVQGFKTIVFLADHGGYVRQLAGVVDGLDRAWRGNGARALYVAPYYDVAYGAFADVLRAQGHGAQIGTHADLIDTALTMALAPPAVRDTALRAAPLPGRSQGVYGGDPRPATPQMGEVGADMQVQAAIKAIRGAEAP